MRGSHEDDSKERRPLQERIHVKAFDEAGKQFQKRLSREGKVAHRERIEDVFYAFLQEQLNTAELFTSQKYGVSFLYAAVDSAAVAKELYAKYAGILPELQQSSEKAQKPERKEFIFGSYISPKVDGVLFTYFEQGLRHIIRDLPQALDDIKNGREPRRHEVYLVSSPARDIGRISDTFLERRKKEKAFDIIGAAYAEFIDQKTKGNQEEKTEIGLRGLSMGASFALKTAEKLLADGVGTQSREESKKTGKPFVEVRIDTPPAQTSSGYRRRWWQMRAGFILHTLVTIAKDPYVRATSSPLSRFMKDMKPLLKEKGIEEDRSVEQKRRKQETASTLLEEMSEGMPPPKGLKVTEVLGLLDITTLSAKQGLAALVHELATRIGRKSSTDVSLAATLISEKDGRRTYGIRSGHNFPNFPPSTVEEMYKIDQLLGALKSTK